MNDTLEIQPVAQPIAGSIRPPGSKSITNRALITAALADGTSRLTGVLDSRDTEVMIDSLRRLQIPVEHDKTTATATVTGCAGTPQAADAQLWLENSGTSIRFLTALCTLGQGDYRLDGNARMRERPIGDLITALRQIGADVACASETHCPPVTINANGLPGGTANISGAMSSQYLSAMLMAGPCAKDAIDLKIDGELVSRPYVDMTLAVMKSFGVTVDATDEQRFHITPQKYRATEYAIEPDASAASYFFAAAAITRRIR